MRLSMAVYLICGFTTAQPFNHKTKQSMIERLTPTQILSEKHLQMYMNFFFNYRSVGLFEFLEYFSYSFLV